MYIYICDGGEENEDAFDELAVIAFLH